MGRIKDVLIRAGEGEVFEEHSPEGRLLSRIAHRLWVKDPFTRGIVSNPEGTAAEFIELPYVEDKTAWEAEADKLLQEAGWQRITPWTDTGCLLLETGDF